MSENDLEILYLDDALIAVNKPSGLLVHRSEIDRHETEFALQRVRDQIGQKVFPVHRLDRPTSGVLLFALNSETARILCDNFSERTIEKHYLAFVRGYTNDAGTIDHAMTVERAYKKGALATPIGEPQEAVTDYSTVERFELPHAVGRYQTCRFSLIQLQPKTGRRHQLRRHMAHISHPILGDTTHGDGRYNRFLREHFASHRLMLVAEKLILNHPISGESITITADPGDEFSRVLQAIRTQVNGSRSSY